MPSRLRGFISSSQWHGSAPLRSTPNLRDVGGLLLDLDQFGHDRVSSAKRLVPFRGLHKSGRWEMELAAVVAINALRDAQNEHQRLWLSVPQPHASTCLGRVQRGGIVKIWDPVLRPYRRRRKSETGNVMLRPALVQEASLSFAGALTPSTFVLDMVSTSGSVAYGPNFLRSRFIYLRKR